MMPLWSLMLFSEGLDFEIKVFLQGADRLSHLLLSFCQNLSYGFTSGTCNKTLYHPCHINQTQIYQYFLATCCLRAGKSAEMFQEQNLVMVLFLSLYNKIIFMTLMVQPFYVDVVELCSITVDCNMYKK